MLKKTSDGGFQPLPQRSRRQRGPADLIEVRKNRRFAPVRNDAGEFQRREKFVHRGTACGRRVARSHRSGAPCHDAIAVRQTSRASATHYPATPRIHFDRSVVGNARALPNQNKHVVRARRKERKSGKPQAGAHAVSLMACSPVTIAVGAAVGAAVVLVLVLRRIPRHGERAHEIILLNADVVVVVPLMPLL